MTLQWRAAAALRRRTWPRLWKGYCEYYEVSLSEDVTDALWRRIMMGARTGRGKRRPKDGAAAHSGSETTFFTPTPGGKGRMLSKTSSWPNSSRRAGADNAYQKR